MLPPSDADRVAIVIVDDPVSVQVEPLAGIAESSILGSLAIIVTGIPGAADPPWRLQEAMVSRFCPTGTVAQLIPGLLTTAVTMVPVLGVLKPGGVTAVKDVLPLARGLNWAVAVVSPPAKTAGETTVPTAGVELFTLTVAANWPLRLAKGNPLTVPFASSNGPLIGSL